MGEAGSDKDTDRGPVETFPEASLCYVSLDVPRRLCHCPLKPSEEMQSAVKLLGNDVMGRWQHFLRKICIDATTSIFPVSSPTLRGQLLYRIEIEHTSVTALLDHGASHSFLSKEWAIRNRVPMKPLSHPFTYSFFNGTHDVISHMAYPRSVQIGPYDRPWTFFVVTRSPCAVVIGLDAIRGWPLFYSPLDDRLFVVEDIGGRGDSKRAASNSLSDKGTSVIETPSPCVDETLLHNVVCPPDPLRHDPMVAQSAPTPPHRTRGWKEASLFWEPPEPEERSPREEAYAKSLDPHRGFLVSPSYPPDRDKHEDIDVVAEDVVDFLRVSLSPWSVEWIGESEEGGEVRLLTVTASGEEEQQLLQRFLSELDPRLRQIVDRFPSLFAPPDPLPPTRSVKHHIYLPNDVVPVTAPAYPLGLVKCSAMREQMRELIDKGWVSPSSSPWASPILLVPKDDGQKLRMCVDFRNLNALTKKDAFPLPRLDNLLHKSAHATIFSKLDLASGFHQIEVHPPHRELTAFILPEAIDGHSLWEWRVMPFGLVNAPPTFQRAMTVALRGCEDFAAVYIDDILIFSANEEDHLKHLTSVFQKLQDQAYHVRLAKCKFMAKEVQFLGHKLTTHGIEHIVKESKDLAGFKPPFTKAKQVRSFLGLVMWYKSFIPHVSTIAAPLFPLTSEKKKFEWTDKATQAVEALKKSILEAPVLAKFDRDLPTRVTTDASAVGIGAVLEQEHGSQWRPVAFWSRKLKDAETRYSATDIEWLAVVDSITLTWRHMLEDIPFLIRSDHKALERKLMKSAQDPPLLPRQIRWIERLMPYSYTFQYIKGSENLVADALSRCPYMLNSVTVVHSVLAGLLARMKIAATQDIQYQQDVLEIARNRHTPHHPSLPATDSRSPILDSVAPISDSRSPISDSGSPIRDFRSPDRNLESFSGTLISNRTNVVAPSLIPRKRPPTVSSSSAP